jgi:hypothetical protein
LDFLGSSPSNEMRHACNDDVFNKLRTHKTPPLFVITEIGPVFYLQLCIPPNPHLRPAR